MLDAGSRTVGVGAVDAHEERRRRQFATLLEHSPDAIVIVDSEGRISEWNPAAEALVGRTRVNAIGVLVAEIVPSEYRAGFDALWARLLDGVPSSAPADVWLDRRGVRVSVRVHIASVTAAGQFAGAVVILRIARTWDVALVSAGQEASSAAVVAGVADQLVGTEGAVDLSVLELDDLTGLPGRRRLQRRLAEPIPPGMERGVAVLDVDAFALVNESLGPDAGDLVLAELGRRLLESTAAHGLGRWQADSFMWVVDGEDPSPALEALSLQVAVALDRPFEVGGERLRLTVSMGLVTGALARERDLVAAAMDALRTAKEAGRDRAVWYDRTIEPSTTRGLRLANDLHRGIQNDELRLHYQPIMDLASNDIVGMEALVRWERPGVGLLNPVSFIDVAERTGQIVQLGTWVARHACEIAAGLAPRPAGPRTVSINVSARQLSDPGLVEMLTTALRETGCPPSALVVEVTETALMDDLATAATTLDTIKELGVGLDLDDFGTGYSSLLYLKHFPVDRIKIDQSFVAGLGSNWADTAIVASTIALAHSIGILAVAEGVETPHQLEQLRAMGCDFAQGFLLSRPIPPEALTDWLNEWVPESIRRAPLPKPEALQGSVERDDAADARDRVANLRDAVADERDLSGDERDDAADARDTQADARDELADARDAAGSQLEAGKQRGPERSAPLIGTGETAPRSPVELHARQLDLRRDATSSRTDAAQDRTNKAAEREQAERDRSAADLSRETDASGGGTDGR
ncbi:putative bifunctional diguanylate cyclase/phosphodiesterase [Pengzhenrongella sicca]|nr:GGDEF domain-containing phosphodiesterase [Pengzhenrongella sicca]